MAVFLQCGCQGFGNHTATGKREGSKGSTSLQWNTCLKIIHGTHSKLHRSAAESPAQVSGEDWTISVKDFFSHGVYVEGFVNSPWAGIILMANSEMPDQAATIMQTLQIQPLKKPVVF